MHAANGRAVELALERRPRLRRRERNDGGPPAANVVSGGVVSIVNVREAGVGSTLPAASTRADRRTCSSRRRASRDFAATNTTGRSPSKNPGRRVCTRTSNPPRGRERQNGALFDVGRRAGAIVVSGGGCVDREGANRRASGQRSPPHHAPGPRTCTSRPPRARANTATCRLRTCPAKRRRACTRTSTPTSTRT